MGYGCVSEIFCTSSWSRGDTVDRRKNKLEQLDVAAIMAVSKDTPNK